MNFRLENGNITIDYTLNASIDYYDTYENYLLDGGIELPEEITQLYSNGANELEINGEFGTIGGNDAYRNRIFYTYVAPVFGKVDDIVRAKELRVGVPAEGEETETEPVPSHTHVANEITDLADILYTKADKEMVRNVMQSVKTVETALSAAKTSLAEKADTEMVTAMMGHINALDYAMETKAESDHTHSYNDLEDKPEIPSLEGLASQDYVNTKIEELVGDAPDILNSFKELSEALGGDANFAETINSKIDNKSDLGHTHTKEDIVDFEHTHDYRTLENLPTIPSIEGLASEEYVNEKISEQETKLSDATASIVDGAPETLNTLSKIANAIGNDFTFSDTIDEKLSKKSNKGHVHSYTDLKDLPDLDTLEQRVADVETGKVNNEEFEDLGDTVETLNTRLTKIEKPAYYKPSETSVTINELKWVENDNLRNMKDKYNTAIAILEDKIDNADKSIVGLDQVDNTSDMDKPVSTLQKEYIDGVISDVTIEADVDQFGNVIDTPDGYPEVSPPVKEYIQETLVSLGNRLGTIPYDVATTTNLGVVKSSETVTVAEDGKLDVPELVTIKEDIATLKVDTDKIGDLSELQTENKNSLIEAINEAFQLGSENKARLVESLASKGISCSTDDSWETLFSYIDSGNITDRSNVTIVARHLLENETAIGPFGIVKGTMPDGNVGEPVSDENPDLLMKPVEEYSYGEYGSTEYGAKKPLLLFRVPKGYYDGNTYLFATALDIAYIIGLTNNKLLKGTEVLTVEGITVAEETAPATRPSLGMSLGSILE